MQKGCCRYTIEKYILFSYLDIFFPVYLNTNKKKKLFLIQILSTEKINPRENTEI